MREWYVGRFDGSLKARHDVSPDDGILLQELLGEPIHATAHGFDDPACTLELPGNELARCLVHASEKHLAIRWRCRMIGHADGAEFTHSEFADHFARQGRRSLNVVGCAGCHRSEHDHFSGSTAHEHANLILEELACVKQPISLWKRLSDPERPAARQHRYFVDRIGMFCGESHGDVSRFVNRRRSTLGWIEHEGATLGPHEHFVARFVDV